MTNTRNRRIGVIAGLVILISFFGVNQYFSQLKEEPPRRPATKSVPMVEVMPALNTSVSTALRIEGELVAYDKIDLFAEVSGTLESTDRPFKVGSYFPKGSILVDINDQEARLNLLSQKATLQNAITQLMPDLKIDYPQSFNQWKTYLDDFDLEKKLLPFPEPLNQQEKYFIASRNLHTQFYSIKSAEERLSKYTLYAPFSGVLTNATINPGSLIRVGQKLGELMNTGSYELQAIIPLSELKYIRKGNPVALISDDINGKWAGTVSRISNQIDPGTQTVQVFIRVSGKGLREGMYLTGNVAAPAIEDAMELPRNLLIEQNTVFTVQDTILTLHPVDVIKLTKEAVIVQGLPNGTPLLATPLPNAYDGMLVKQKSGAKHTDQAPATPIGSIE